MSANRRSRERGAKDATVLERNILRALCVLELSGNDRAQALAALAKYGFHDAHHQILFDVLREIPAASPELLRERLPALLTRRGFPDFDADFFLCAAQSPASDLSAGDLLAAIARLNREVESEPT